MQARATGSFLRKVMRRMKRWALGGCQPGEAPVSRLLVPAGCTVVQRLGRRMPWRSQYSHTAWFTISFQRLR